MTVILIKIFLVILVTGGTVLAFDRRKKKGKSTFSYRMLLALIGIASLLAWYLTDLIPMPTEEVRITALGQKNASARNNALYLTGVYVDGEQVELKTATDERWFWQEDWYIWLNEADVKRPKGISNSFVLKLPAGKERYIEFSKNVHKGLVQIDYQQESQIIDCYSEDRGRITAQIPDSNVALMVLYYGISFVSFTALIILFILICNMLLQWNTRHNNCLVKYIVAHQNILIYIGLAIMMQITMLYYHQFNPMIWRDDWFNISVVLENSLWEMIEKWNLSQRDVTPPLFNIIAFFWIRMIPNTVESLFVLPQIFLFFSVIIMGECGEHLFGKWGGIFAAIITSTSSTLMISTGYEFRSYSMLFMFSALSMLLFIRSLENSNYQKKNDVLFTLSLIGLLYSHYFGIMTVGALFLADTVYCALKDKNPFAILSQNMSRLTTYIVSVGVWLIWMLSTFYYYSKEMGQSIRDTWRSIPFLSDTIITFEYFLSNYTILKIVFGISICVLFVGFINFIKNQSEIDSSSNRMREILILFSIINTFILVFSAYLISQSIAMYASRYFVASIPSVIILLVFGIHFIFKLLKRCKRSKKIIVGSFLVISLFYSMNVSMTSILQKGNTALIIEENIRPTENYMKVIDELANIADINYQTTAICIIPQAGAYGGQKAYEFFLNTDKTREVNAINNGEPEKYMNYDVLYMITYCKASTFSTVVQKDSALNENFIYDKSYCNGAIQRYVRKK